MVTTKHLKSLYKKIPIPIKEMGLAQYNAYVAERDGHWKFKQIEYGGVYHSPIAGNLKKSPRYWIAINKNLNNAQKLSTYYHELRHYICELEGCECANKYSWLSEYHAFQYCLKMLLKLKAYQSLADELKNVAYMAKHNDLNLHHTACKKLLRTQLWRDCKKAVKKSKESGFLSK